MLGNNPDNYGSIVDTTADALPTADFDAVSVVVDTPTGSQDIADQAYTEVSEKKGLFRKIFPKKAKNPDNQAILDKTKKDLGLDDDLEADETLESDDGTEISIENTEKFANDTEKSDDTTDETSETTHIREDQIDAYISAMAAGHKKDNASINQLVIALTKLDKPMDTGDFGTYLELATSDLSVLGEDRTTRKKNANKLLNATKNHPELNKQSQKLILTLTKSLPPSQPVYKQLFDANKDLFTNIGDTINGLDGFDGLKNLINFVLQALAYGSFDRFVSRENSMTPAEKQLFDQTLQQANLSPTMMADTDLSQQLNKGYFTNQMYDVHSITELINRQPTPVDAGLIHSVLSQSSQYNTKLGSLFTQGKNGTMAFNADAFDGDLANMLLTSDTFKNIIITQNDKATSQISNRSELHAMMIRTLLQGQDGAMAQRYDEHMTQTATTTTNTETDTETSDESTEQKTDITAPEGFTLVDGILRVREIDYPIDTKQGSQKLLHNNELYTIDIDDKNAITIKPSEDTIDYTALLTDTETPLILHPEEILANKNVNKLVLDAFATDSTIDKKKLTPLKRTLTQTVNTLLTQLKDPDAGVIKKFNKKSFDPLRESIMAIGELADVSQDNISSKDGKLIIKIDDKTSIELNPTTLYDDSDETDEKERDKEEKEKTS